MFKPSYQKGVCPDCPPDRISLIVVRAGFCQKHNEDRKKEKKANRIRVNEPKVQEALSGLEKIKKNKFKTQKKSTGEKEIFLEIWNERRHYCSNLNCNEYLGEEPLAQYFSHLKSKGAHGELRLDKSNIILLCFDCHFIYDNGDRSKIILSYVNEGGDNF